MKSKMMKQKETETVFGRGNYMILLIGSALIIAGYLLMSGEGVPLPPTILIYSADCV